VAPTIPTLPPTAFRTADTVQFTLDAGDYPVSEGWTIKWNLAGPSEVVVTATTSGTGYLVSLTSAVNTLTPGTYRWTLTAEKGSGATAERYTFDEGTVAVQANPAAASAGNQKLTDETELALLNTAIAARIAGDVAEYSIGERSLRKLDLSELLAWRARLRAKIARRKRGGQLRTIQHRFRDG
jgi:hypothetical protein